MAWFDGVTWPQIIVAIELGGLPPSGNTLVLNVGPGLNTATLGGGTYVNVEDGIRSVSWGRGRASEVDPANPGTLEVTFTNQSGKLDPTNTASPYYPQIDMGLPVRAQAVLGGVAYDLGAGELADISMDAGLDPTITFTVADGLEKLGRAKLTTLNPPQFDGDTTGVRIGHVLDAVTWPTSQRALDAGYSVCGPTVYGDNALELCRKAERTEFGLLFCDGANNVVFYDRYRSTTATRSTVVQANITDQSAAGELGMMELEVSRSRERMINDWHITRDPVPSVPVGGGGMQPPPEDVPVEQVAFDQTSKDQYGLLSGPDGYGELLRLDEEALAMAQGLVPWFKDPVNRVREVRLNALHPRVVSENLWPTLLGLRLLDRISVRRDYGPVTIGPVELLVQAVAGEIRADTPSFELRLTTSHPTPASNLFVLNTSVLNTGALGW